jgi:hypothetical protein
VEEIKTDIVHTRWTLHTKHATHPRVKEEIKRDKIYTCGTERQYTIPISFKP